MPGKEGHARAGIRAMSDLGLVGLHNRKCTRFVINWMDDTHRIAEFASDQAKKHQPGVMAVVYHPTRRVQYTSALCCAFKTELERPGTILRKSGSGQTTTWYLSEPLEATSSQIQDFDTSSQLQQGDTSSQLEESDTQGKTNLAGLVLYSQGLCLFHFTLLAICIQAELAHD